MAATTPLWADTIAAFDTETTGVNPHEARIVSASIVLVTANGVVSERYDWLINPGIPIPPQASAVHGITTEVAEVSGMRPDIAIAQIVERLFAMLERGFPIAAYNAPFDLTLLREEAKRHGVDWPDVVSPVIDPLIIDKQVDRYRKGKRQLALVAEHYGVTLDNAHDAGSDAISTAHIVQALAKQYAKQLPTDVAELHTSQISWAAEQAQSLQEYFDRIGRTGNPVNGAWPIHA
ncbi:MAG: 3'-5' exonuclease [Canibacter sp.]